MLGCDVVVTAGEEAMRTLDVGRTRVVLNSRFVPTAQFQLRPDVDFRADALRARIDEGAGADCVETLDAAGIASRLLGDSIGSNMMLVGYALQRGLLPVGAEAIEQAIRLNGVAVDMNLRALALGRLAAHAPERLAALTGGGASATAAEQRAPHTDAALDDLVEVHRKHLTQYQDAALGARYAALVARVRDAERTRVPSGKGELALAVARNYARLLAYKDEYEVARLYSDGVFDVALAEQFGAGARASVLLAPPLLARRDPQTGVPRKIEFGPWVFRVLAVLARLRFARGRWFDPFGHTAERRMERRLIVEYESMVEELVRGLDAAGHALAVELASSAARLRGFGHVKQASEHSFRSHVDPLLARWRDRPDLRVPAATATSPAPSRR